MANKYNKLNDDISRLIPIFEAEIGNEVQKELTIYSYQDKSLPPNPILYYHHDTVKELETEGILRILRISNNIEEHAPKFAGPYFYVVNIFAKKVKEKAQAEQTITKQPPKPLPSNVTWKVSNKEFLLEFADGKKLAFNDISKLSAQYFNLLVENHGLPVEHEIAKNLLKFKDTFKPSAEYDELLVEDPEAAKRRLKIEEKEGIRNLVKTLKEKIEHAMLGTKIKIGSERKAAYMLTISS